MLSRMDKFSRKVLIKIMILLITVTHTGGYVSSTILHIIIKGRVISHFKANIT